MPLYSFAEIEKSSRGIKRYSINFDNDDRSKLDYLKKYHKLPGVSVIRFLIKSEYERVKKERRNEDASANS